MGAEADRGLVGALPSLCLRRKAPVPSVFGKVVDSVHPRVSILNLSIGVCIRVCRNTWAHMSWVPKAQVNRDTCVSCFTIPQPNKLPPLPCTGATRDYETILQSLLACQPSGKARFESSPSPNLCLSHGNASLHRHGNSS